jgi:hypothetical protein
MALVSILRDPAVKDPLSGAGVSVGRFSRFVKETTGLPLTPIILLNIVAD